MIKRIQLKLFCAILFIALLSSGCGTIIPRNITTNQFKLQDKIDDISIANKNLVNVETNKLNLISSFSYGIKYTLDNDTNIFNENINTASLLNNRILSLSGYPNISDIKTMEDLVDKLNSDLITLQAEGKVLLDNKDKQIMKLVAQTKTLETELAKANENLIYTAQKQAEKADNNKVIIDTINSYYGLGAVFYGLKRFVTTCFITLLVITIVYLVLRVLSTMNPIAAAIFNMVETLVSYLIKLLKVLAPKSTIISGLSDTAELNKYKNTLENIVDSIELLQANKSDAEKGHVTLTEIMTEFSKNMDYNDKSVIKEIKTNLKW